MRDQWSRRGFFGLCGATGAVMLLPSCSSNERSDDQASGPVTLSHVFGETIVPAPPSRVVCAGYTGQDELLALGVVPIAVTNWFGDQPFAVWPWAQPLLGDAKPVVLSLEDGIPIKQIADLKPDLIIATNAGVDADTYQKLTAVAPTVPQSNGDAFFEPWKVQAGAIGRAVHRGQQMQSLLADVDGKFTAVAGERPGFKSRKVLLLDGRLDRGTITVETGWRTAFLNQMGLTVADSAETIEPARISSTLAGADVLIWTTESDQERAALLADPEIATYESRSVFTTKDQAGAIAFASPLSYPLVAQQLPALIATITG